MTSFFNCNYKLVTGSCFLCAIIIALLTSCQSFFYKNRNLGNTEIKEPVYNIPAVLKGKLCTSKLKDSYYYPVPNVCKLNCSLEPIPYPKTVNGGCKKVAESVTFEGNEIQAIHDVDIVFTNTYMYHNQSKEQNQHKITLKEGEKTKILYEQISVLDSNKNETLYLKFIPTKLSSTKRKSSQYNVNLYLLDGLSRSQFSEQMLETINYLNSITDEFDIFEFYRYHTIGHNSIPNYLPIFYGINETIANDDKNKTYYKELPNKIYSEHHYKTILLQQFCDRKLDYHHPHISHIGCDHEFLLGCHPDMF